MYRYYTTVYSIVVQLNGSSGQQDITHVLHNIEVSYSYVTVSSPFSFIY